MNLYFIIILLVLFIGIIIYKKLSTSLIDYIKRKNNINENTKYYDVDIFPELKKIDKYKNKIKLELDVLLENQLNEWIDWPEKNLYDSEKNMWKIMPLYYHGIFHNKNCDKMPALTTF